MKRLVVATAVAAALGFPAAAQAQILGSYCNPGQAWCFDATAFSFTEAVGGGGTSEYTASLTGVFSGSGLSGLADLNWFFFLRPAGFVSALSNDVPFAVGTSTTNATTVVEAASGLTDFSASELDIRWASRPVGPTGFCNSFAGDCEYTEASVPEPGVLLLLLAGVLGLGVVALRRRDQLV